MSISGYEGLMESKNLDCDYGRSRLTGVSGEMGQQAEGREVHGFVRCMQA